MEIWIPSCVSLSVPPANRGLAISIIILQHRFSVVKSSLNTSPYVYTICLLLLSTSHPFLIFFIIRADESTLDLEWQRKFPQNTSLESRGNPTGQETNNNHNWDRVDYSSNKHRIRLVPIYSAFDRLLYYRHSCLPLWVPNDREGLANLSRNPILLCRQFPNWQWSWRQLMLLYANCCRLYWYLLRLKSTTTMLD